MMNECEDENYVVGDREDVDAGAVLPIEVSAIVEANEQAVLAPETDEQTCLAPAESDSAVSLPSSSSGAADPNIALTELCRRANSVASIQSWLQSYLKEAIQDIQKAQIPAADQLVVLRDFANELSLKSELADSAVVKLSQAKQVMTYLRGRMTLEQFSQQVSEVEELTSDVARGVLQAWASLNDLQSRVNLPTSRRCYSRMYRVESLFKESGITVARDAMPIWIGDWIEEAKPVCESEGPGKSESSSTT